MAGSYRINKKKYQQCLHHWLDNVIEERLWLKYDNLHIDEIDYTFSDRNTWIEGGLFLLDCMREIMDMSVYSCFLAIELSDSAKLTDLSVINIEYLKRELYSSPPSIYVFPKNEISYNQTLNASVFLNNLSHDLNLNVYFREELGEGVMFSRFVYFRYG